MAARARAIERPRLRRRYYQVASIVPGKAGRFKSKTYGGRKYRENQKC